ncbi:MAG: hypothetical protein J5563_00500 [Clostridia bacterium]|nr:hypothetical protein [Clostridia bacterium]
MKKLLVFVAVAAAVFCLTVCPSGKDMEKNVGKINVGFGSPVADGVIGPDEYSAHVTLDDSNMKALTTISYDVPAGHKIEAYFSWDDDYLYVAYDATDVTRCPSGVDGAGNWQFNGDNIQFFADIGPVLAYRELLDTEARGGRRSTIFAVGMNANDTYFYLHQLSGNDAIINLSPDPSPSAAVSTDQGWTAEIAVPWDTLINDLNAKVEDTQISRANIGNGAVVKALIIYNDMETAGTLKNMFGTTFSDYSQPFDWQPEEFGIELVLYGGNTIAETVKRSPNLPPETAEETSPGSSADTDNPPAGSIETPSITEKPGEENKGGVPAVLIVCACALACIIAAVVIAAMLKGRKK